MRNCASRLGLRRPPPAASDNSRKATALPPYQKAAPVAHYMKAIAQMLVGVVAAFCVLVTVVLNTIQHDTAQSIQIQIFGVIGIGLAVAAAIELAYTLFTSGPDEVLDSLLMAISAALILELANGHLLRWQSALALAPSMIPIAALFKIRATLNVQEPQKNELSGQRCLIVAVFIFAMLAVAAAAAVQCYVECPASPNESSAHQTAESSSPLQNTIKIDSSRKCIGQCGWMSFIGNLGFCDTLPVEPLGPRATESPTPKAYH